MTDRENRFTAYTTRSRPLTASRRRPEDRMSPARPPDADRLERERALVERVTRYLRLLTWLLALATAIPIFWVVAALAIHRPDIAPADPPFFSRPTVPETVPETVPDGGRTGTAP